MYLEIFLYIIFHHAFSTILYNDIYAFPTKLHNNIHDFQISTDFIYTDICYANYLTKAYAINLDHFLDHHLDHFCTTHILLQIIISFIYLQLLAILVNPELSSLFNPPPSHFLCINFAPPKLYSTLYTFEPLAVQPPISHQIGSKVIKIIQVVQAI